MRCVQFMRMIQDFYDRRKIYSRLSDYKQGLGSKRSGECRVSQAENLNEKRNFDEKKYDGINRNTVKGCRKLV